MTQRIARACVLLALLAPSGALAQGAPDQGPGGAPQVNPSIANPATSVIGWFQSVAGNDPLAQRDPFSLREAELGFQAPVDPFTRADFFLSAGPDGFDVEEGYLTWLALPAGFQAKVGKFRADLGKFNRTHPPETPFADRPLAADAFFGEEGVATMGAAVSTLIPNPLGLYWDAIGEVGTIPRDSPLWFADSRTWVLAVGRTSAFVPLHDSADLAFGVSYANALGDSSLRREGEHAQVGVLDATFHWKNPRRSIYRSLFAQAEWIGERGSADTATVRRGAYGYVVWQFARQWKVGARADWTEAPGAGAHEQGGLVLLQYQPSEFSVVSVQARRVKGFDGLSRDTAFFKWTFNIGPHGAHPY